jgi:hypothetical protein
LFRSEGDFAEGANPYARGETDLALWTKDRIKISHERALARNLSIMGHDSIL